MSKKPLKIRSTLLTFSIFICILSGCMDLYRIDETDNRFDKYQIYSLGEYGAYGTQFLPRKVIKETGSYYAVEIIHTSSDWLFIQQNPLKVLVKKSGFEDKFLELKYIREIDTEVDTHKYGTVTTIEKILYEVTYEQLKTISQADIAEIRIIGKSEYKIETLRESELGYLQRFLQEPFNDKTSLSDNK